jgi:uncharacterized membrane protein
MKGNAGLWVALIIVFSAALFIFSPLNFTGFFVATTGENASLSLWDFTEQTGGPYYVYASGSPLGSRENSTTTPAFYANYTNLTSGESINGTDIECNISFYISDAWTAKAGMAFNATSGLYEYSRSFASRGLYLWNVTCYGSAQGYDVLNATDNITVTNTPAAIYVPLLPTTCYEDTLCTYKFSEDCYDIDDVDENNLTYGYKAGTQFTGFGMNTAGNVTVNITNDIDCGDFLVTLVDKDSTGWGATADKEFVINAVNDRPVLGSMQNSSFQNSSLFYDVNANDEENETGPFTFNVTFLACYRPFNFQHTNATNCSGLLTINSSTGVINRSIIFANSEVGNYTLNLTVTDSGDNATAKNIPPYTWLANETDWYVFNFTITDINDQPLIAAVPNQIWAQGQSVTLVINASDIDNGTLVFSATTLYRNLTSYVNASLFPISVNQTTYLDNGTSLGNATMSFSPLSNSQVGNYTVNISVYDGRANGTYSLLVNFTVTNINDPPVLNFTCGNYSVQGLTYYCNVSQNTTDPDNFASYVPYTDSVNGTLSYSINFTYCNKTFNASDTNCTIFGINTATGAINYTDPQRHDAGNYTVNVSVTDGGSLTTFSLFNFTVIPDYAPDISSVPAQTTMQGQPFNLSINATDEDNATDTLDFRTETYYMNGTPLSATKFPIQTYLGYWPPGPATGVLNYTSVNNSQVGNYTIKVIVNDSYGREDSAVFNITVYNLNDPPVLNFSCLNYTNESTYYTANSYLCSAGQNTTDPDLDTPYGENLTYNMTFITGLLFFSINSSTGLINFTATNDTWANNTLNYTYVVNITVRDIGNLTDSRLLNITVIAVNDPPVINITNTSISANSTYFENVSSDTTDEENNLPFVFNLTIVNCTKENVSDTNCSVLTINQTTGIITFYAPEKDVGNYTLNITASDSGNTTQPYNATGRELASFRILSLNHPPAVNIAGVIPSSTFSENDNVIFAINTSDPDSDVLYCSWYRGGTHVASVSSCQNANSWTYTPGFDESGSWTMRLEATDTHATSFDEWSVTINNRNRPPELIYPIQNQSWNMNTVNMNIVLSYNFRDLDNDNSVTNDDNNLTISYTNPGHIAVLIDGQIGNITVPAANWTGKAIVSLTPQTDWHGIEYITFTINDSQYAVSSNNVSLNVSYTETQTQTIIQQSGGGGGATGTKIASLTITVSPMDKIQSYNRTSALVAFKNTGQVALNGISIKALSNETNEIQTSLTTSSISSLAVDQSATTTLNIMTFELTKENYEIKITGSVNDPRFNQSTTIYIRPIFNETRVEEKLKFVKDLFQDNPECLDLMELIVQAEKEISQNNVERAKDLTQAALDNCRDIISYSNATKRKVTPEIENIPLNEIIIALLTIALFSILAYLLIERRAESKKVTNA